MRDAGRTSRPGWPRMSISHLIATYGYWAVLALVAAESVGIPLPGETALIIAVAVAGAIAGDNIGYWIGHKGGHRLARKYGPKVRLDERKLKIARYLFDTHGPTVVFFGRFISVLRTYAAFLPANVTGAIAWAGGPHPGRLPGRRHTPEPVSHNRADHRRYRGA